MFNVHSWYSPHREGGPGKVASRPRSPSLDADMERRSAGLGKRKMPGPAGPDPATLGEPGRLWRAPRAILV